MITNSKIPNTQQLFTKEVVKVLRYILDKGFILTLVGGATRDYLLFDNTGLDLDFEIRFVENFSERCWKEKLHNLAKDLEQTFSLKIEKLPFSIFRMLIGVYTVELSSPRVENFGKKLLIGHKNFKAILKNNLSYVEAFKRRDFTINAIGIEFKLINGKENSKIIDPFNGTKDLLKKNLKNIDMDFYLDPVRFLRMIRFCITKKFTIDDKIIFDLNKFDLRKLPKIYFINESMKASFFPFCKIFYKFVKKHKIGLADEYKDLSFLTDIDSTFTPCTKEEVLFILITNEIKELYLLRLVKTFEISKRIYNNMLNFFLNLKMISKISVSDLEDNIKNQDIKYLLLLEEILIINKYIILISRTNNMVNDLAKFLPDTERMAFDWMEQIIREKGKIKIDNFDIEKISKRNLTKYKTILIIKHYYYSSRKNLIF